eukprot:TRINITY_DN10743_c0_g1_i1.p1 TRINITY_DN10743_c0_g1~~TRINITY_DN10743_c0_g1_i1.p1  ORF type:complete len:140 (+),score=10.88 TRINITY_DN10743_c0_g1_i1:91-510(+)
MVYLAVSSGLLFFCGAAHSFLGEKGILPRLLSLPDLPIVINKEFSRALFRLAWHATSMAWVTLGGILLIVHMGTNQNHLLHDKVEDANKSRIIKRTVQLIGVFGIATTVAIFATTGRRHIAWPLFLASGIFALYGGKQF